MSKYAKFWIAFAFAVLIGGLTALETALGDEVITTQEVVTILLAFLAAGAVWFVPNKPPDAEDDTGAYIEE